jgi:hypothetical protein
MIHGQQIITHIKLPTLFIRIIIYNTVTFKTQFSIQFYTIFSMFYDLWKGMTSLYRADLWDILCFFRKFRIMCM